MKRIGISLVLTLSLVFVFASAASAAPSVPSVPHSPSCTNWVYSWYGGIATDGPLHTQAFAGALYDAATGASCDTFRAGVKTWSDYNVTMSWRFTWLVWYPSGDVMAGSQLHNYSVYTQGTTPTYLFGPSVGGIPCGWTFFAVSSVSDTSGHYPGAGGQMMSGSC
jgi:hypothetical protein